VEGRGGSPAPHSLLQRAAVMTPVLLHSWQQLGSALTQEMIPFVMLLTSIQTGVVEPFYEPDRWDALQPFDTSGRGARVGDFFEFDLLFDKEVNVSRIRCIDEVALRPLCKRRLHAYPPNVHINSSTCVDNETDLERIIKSSSQDAVLVHTAPHYITGWKMTKPKESAVRFRPSFVDRNLQLGVSMWGVVPASCIHIRVEKLQLSGVDVDTDGCVARMLQLHANEESIVMHDMGNFGSATGYERKNKTIVPTLMKRHNIRARSFCDSLDFPFCQLMDGSVCKTSAVHTSCIGGGTFGWLVTNHTSDFLQYTDCHSRFHEAGS